mgnify:CR=1 FL=1
MVKQIRRGELDNKSTRKLENERRTTPRSYGFCEQPAYG